MAGKVQSGVFLPMLNWDNRDQAYAYNEGYSFLNSYFVINNVKEEEKWHYIVLSSGTKGHEVMNSWGLDEATKKVSANVFSRNLKTT